MNSFEQYILEKSCNVTQSMDSQNIAWSRKANVRDIRIAISFHFFSLKNILYSDPTQLHIQKVWITLTWNLSKKRKKKPWLSTIHFFSSLFLFLNISIWINFFLHWNETRTGFWHELPPPTPVSYDLKREFVFFSCRERGWPETWIGLFFMSWTWVRLFFYIVKRGWAF